MKKNHFIARKGLFSLALAAVGAMFLGSCAVDGFDDKEKFDNGVSGVKLESPELSTKTVAASDGSDKLQVSWKVVYGAGGYECKAYNVDDPDNPEEVASDTIDGTSFQFKIAEDTKYKIAVRTLGNKSKNNTEADKATELEYIHWFQRRPFLQVLTSLILLQKSCRIQMMSRLSSWKQVVLIPAITQLISRATR